MKNEIYWDYNPPLQVAPIHDDPEDETSEVVGTRILNYMPRKERCVWLDLEEANSDEQTREEFFNQAAEILERLADQMREAARDPTILVYYP